MAEIKLKIASVVIGSGEGGGGGVAPYYADLPDKPSINGETLSGDMTSEDLGLASESQAVPSGGTTGQVLAKKSNADNDVQWVNQQSGGQGTTDYADLDNKPQINSVTLSGNKSASDLGLATAAQGTKADTAYQKPNGGIPDTDLSSAVRTSLGKVDTALQSVVVGTTTTGAAGTNASVENSGSLTEPVLNFTIPRGADGHNPNLGSYIDLSDAPTTNIQDGDFIVLIDTTQTPVTGMICTWNGSAWQSTGMDANMAYFGSGELLASVNIDNSHLVNPADGALPTAADVLQLKAKLEGVTASEEKASHTIVDGYYINYDGSLREYSSGHYTVIPINGAKKVRFLGSEISSQSGNNYSYAFWNNPTYVDSSTVVFSSYYDVKTGETFLPKEYVVNVPDGATYIAITVPTDNVPNFYCYLQSGESVIEVIDGLDKKINGEDYEVIGGNILPASLNVEWRICNSSATGTDNALTFDNSNRSISINLTGYRGKRFLVKANASHTSYYMVLKKAISSTSAPYTVQQLIDGEYLCEEIHNLNGTWYPSRGIESNKTVEIPIPNDAIRILFAGTVIGDNNYNRVVQSVQVISTEHVDGTIDSIKEELQQQIDGNKEDIEELQDVGEQVDGLIDDLYGVSTEITETPLMYVRKGSLDPTAFYVNPSIQTIYEIDISDATKVNISAQADYYFILFVSKAKLPTSGSNLNVSAMRSNYMAVCDGFAPKSNQYRIIVNGGVSIELTLNENCKYLYISKYYSSQDRTPSSITTTKTKRVGGFIEQILEEEESNVGNALRLVIKDGKCFTAPIPCEKGFHLLVKDDYRIPNAYLVDHLTGNIVNDDFITNSNISDVQNKACRRRSNMCKMPGFDIIYQIEKLDGSIIESSSDVIEDFSIVEDLYTRKLPTGVEPSIYRAWRDKVQTSIGNVWIPSLQADNKIPQSHNNNNPKRFGKGTTYIGVNYSGPTQWGKHVGMQVSMRTFKTAVANPRSVMYTEIIGSYGPKTAQSKYGYTHNSYGKEAGAFYGCVCTGLTSYLMGFPMVFQSYVWDGGSVATQMNIVMQGTTSNPNVISCNGNAYSYDSKDDCKALAELLQPMDFIWKDGHCAAISDIYVDEWGEVKYIVISEQTTPTSTSNAYTPEYFFLRFKNNIDSGDNWKILRRKSAWTIEDASIPRTNQDKEFVVMNNSQYNPEDMGVIDPDITTFAGEYAVFVIGDYSDATNNFKLFLNIHRGGAEGYTHIQIFNEDDDETTATPIDEIDITGYQTDSSLGTNGYILPTDEDEDWIIYNLAEYWRTSQTNNTGKFKARVVRKESGSIVEGFASGCTHFMMVAMSLNISNSTINYIIKGAIPVVYEGERENGLFDGNSRYKNLVLGTDYTYNSETGEYTSVGTPLVNWTGDYLALFANTDYGMAKIRVAI